MRRWQLSAFALGTPAKRAKPLSAAAASAALPNIVLPKVDFRRSVCSRIHPPWAPPWCWLGFVLRPCIWNTATRKMSLGREEKSGSTMRSEHDRTESSQKKLFLANSQAMRASSSRDLFIKELQTRG